MTAILESPGAIIHYTLVGEAEYACLRGNLFGYVNVSLVPIRLTWTAFLTGEAVFCIHHSHYGQLADRERRPVEARNRFVRLEHCPLNVKGGFGPLR